MKQSNTYLNVPFAWCRSEALGFSSLPHEHQTDTPTLRAWSAHKSIALLVWLLCCCFVPTTALYAQTQFITKWDLSKTGVSTTALTFGVAVASTGAATYTWNTVPAGTSGSGTIAASAISVTISGLPAGAMIEVKINPTNFQRVNINNGTDRARLLDVSQWGTTVWTSMATAFYGCYNLNITATDVPILTGVTSMTQMFSNCSVLNGPSNIGTWNTASITNMSFMFSGATVFNQNIGTWNTTAVTDMSFMFRNAKAFNENIGTWNTAAVTNMLSMFYEATAFNQNIGNWSTAAVTSMSLMFYNAKAFNENIGTWNTAAVTDMSSMFDGTTAFNQNISTWNTIKVTNMSYMFQNTTAFNQNISTWNTIKVTNMSNMFNSATAFNQNIGTWNTAAVTNMSSMFYDAKAFNQNIGAWNTVAVTRMLGMFAGTTAFNENIGTWNTAAVTNMSLMFYNAKAFNQNISTWNVAAVTNMSNMFNSATAYNQSLAAWGTKFNALVNLTNCLDNCGMNIANYEATLTGFAATTRTGRSLGATGLKYCNATDRTILVTPTASGGKGWIITGDVQNCAPGCACDPTCNPIPTDSGTYTATTTNVIGGYTHYCDGIGHLLLSLKIPAGTTIPASAVKVKVGATAATFYSRYCGGTDAASSCFMSAADGNALINRNWFINLADVTGTAIGIGNRLSIVSYFKDSDYDALNTTLTTNGGTALLAKTGLKLYLPKASTTFGEFPIPSMVKPLNSILAPWNNGTTPTTSIWQLLTAPQTGINAVEFKVSNIKNTGGIGKF